MRKPVAVNLRAIHAPRNGRPARRARVAAAASRAWRRLFEGWGFFRGLRRAIGEVVAMAFVLALAIVLAHAMLIVLFPV
jgi:hypothetical protein